MKNTCTKLLFIIALVMTTISLFSQTIQDTTKPYKNIIRYDVSGAILFGIDKHIVFGYERVLTPNQSFSINVGSAALLKAERGDVTTDSFTFNDDVKNTGFKINADYRFYLRKENKYNAPHGVFIGAYFSYSQFKRDNQWNYNDANSQGKLVNTTLKMDIFTMGGEMGYQFILGKHIAIDFVLIGPGLGFYDINAKVQSDLTDAEKEQLRGAIKDLITDKFPGLNRILASEDFDSEGTIKTWNFGFRYLIHIGYFF